MTCATECLNFIALVLQLLKNGFFEIVEASCGRNLFNRMEKKGIFLRLSVMLGTEINNSGMKLWDWMMWLWSSLFTGAVVQPLILYNLAPSTCFFSISFCSYKLTYWYKWLWSSFLGVKSTIHDDQIYQSGKDAINQWQECREAVLSWFQQVSFLAPYCMFSCQLFTARNLRT